MQIHTSHKTNIHSLTVLLFIFFPSETKDFTSLLALIDFVIQSLFMNHRHFLRYGNDGPDLYCYAQNDNI
jgi:hypothetical protein